MDTPFIDISFAATELGVREAMQAVMAILRAQADGDAPVGGDLLNAMEIALTEALNNVTEHGYGDGAVGAIELAIWRSAAGYRVRILDHGRPYPGGVIPSANHQDLDGAMQDLPEGGFGWMLIHELTQRLDYVRRGGKNHLHLWFAA